MAVLGTTAPALGGAPVDGVYTSAAGDLLEGRFSEAWVGGGQGQIGNTVYAWSWDEVTPATQWELLCPALATPPDLIEDTVDEYGNGHRVYRTEYTGGMFMLEGSGPWGGGDAWYFGDLYYYVHTTTMQFQDWELIGYTTNAQLSGYFSGYEKCMQLTIANAASQGIGGIPPADYPELRTQEGGCVPVPPGVIGEWGTVWSLTMVISNCSTAAEGMSWTAVKSLYR